MQKSQSPREYFKQPIVDKPIEQIYADLDSYTWERLIGDDYIEERAFAKVLLPPVCYQQRFLKGLCYSPSTDALLGHCAEMGNLFVTMAISMCCSYPWSEAADAYLTYYDNPERAQWFRQTRPAVRASKVMIPLADADFTNERFFAPIDLPHGRSLDLLTVSTLWEEKNLPIVLEAVKIYSAKYRPISMALMIGRELSDLSDREQQELAKIQALIEDLGPNFELIERVNHGVINEFYARSKVCVLGSLLEGSNRSIKEAMCCDTPIVCFKQYNQYARGNSKIFPPGAGLCAEFGSEPLADAIHEVLENRASFTPRASYLAAGGGRASFFNQCMDQLPYYRESLPGYTAGKHTTNEWLNAAIIDNYGVTLEDFIYGEDKLSWIIGLSTLQKTMQCFRETIGL